MIEKSHNDDVQVYGTKPSATKTFGFDTAGQKRIFKILRDSVYSNKVLAVIRELIANAWDAHIQAGVPDRRIHISFPKITSPTFVVRDYGNGLSHEDMCGAYTNYGGTSKDQDPNAVGFMGIGAKSPFCYTSMFTVRSFHEGVARTYSMSLNAEDDEEMSLIREVPSSEPSGLEVIVPVKYENIKDFAKEAISLLMFMDPTPDCNIDIPKLPKDFNKSDVGYIDFEHRGDRVLQGWHVLMGFVPYYLDISMLKDLLDVYEMRLMRSYNGILKVPMGAVRIPASRESISYDEDSKNVVVDRLREMISEAKKTFETEIVGLTPYKVYRSTIKFRHKWKRHPEAGTSLHAVWKPSPSYKILDASSWKTTLMAEVSLFNDNDATVDSVGFQDSTLSVRNLFKSRHEIPKYWAIPSDHTKAGVAAALEDFREDLKKAELDGIEFLLSSSFDPIKRPKNTERSLEMLEYEKSDNGDFSRSTWTDTHEKPTSEDILMTLAESNKTKLEVQHVKLLCRAAGIKTPKIYRYKKVRPTSGMSMEQWILNVINTHAKSSGFEDLILDPIIGKRISEDFYHIHLKSKTLPEEHPIRKFIQKWEDKSGMSYNIPWEIRNNTLLYTLAQAKLERVLSEIYDAYPVICVMTCRDHNKVQIAFQKCVETKTSKETPYEHRDCPTQEE